MHRVLAAGSAILIAGFVPSPSPAVSTTDTHPRDLAPALDYATDSAPHERRLPSASGRVERALGDTTLFGYIDASGLAVPGETWTWDHGHPTDPFEGWTVIEVDAQDHAFFRRIDTAEWTAPGNGNLVEPPILSGAASAWVGAHRSEADTLCWMDGLGYGDNWNQRLESPVFDYAGSGDVVLAFTYFSDLESGHDYTRVYLRRLPFGNELLVAGSEFTGQTGLSVNHPAEPPVGVAYQATVSAADIAGAPQFQLVFELDTDGAWSDQDGEYPTEYGPFAIDDLTVSGATTGGPFAYDFETDLGGWTPVASSGPGPFFVLDDTSAYGFLDPCECNLSGNVIAFHDAMHEHPYGQHQRAISNPVDVASVPDPGSGALSIFALWDQYAELPVANGVFFLPGWVYYPYQCAQTGTIGWSPRVGQTSFNWVGDLPLCTWYHNAGTGNGVPADVEQVRFVYEIMASCDAFGIPPTDCTGITNASPIIDNVRVGVVYTALGPGLSWDYGGQLADGFSQSEVNDPFVGGNADCVRSINLGNPPFVLYDVPILTGPVGTATPWDARLHFRVHREGPGASAPAFAHWAAWKAHTGVGVGPTASFASGQMDTTQVGGIPVPNRDRYEGYYREDDPNNPSPGTEGVEANEILVDNVPPGTQIDYFASAHFRATPSEITTLPDTSGGNYLNFEILPRWREDGGVLKFPSILYIDNFNRGAEYYITSALDGLGYDYDIFDRLDAVSNWTPPFARGPDLSSNNGMTLAQLRDYRAVLVNCGFADNALRQEDSTLLHDWLTAEICTADRRGLLVNGSNAADGLAHTQPNFLEHGLGATIAADSYLEATGDENFCVNLEATPGALYGTTNSVGGAYDYGAWGNGCPSRFGFTVLSPIYSGVGNRVYVNAETGVPAPYAQIVAESLTETQNYRTVLDGTSWHSLTARDGPGDPNCEPTGARIIGAIENELAAAMEWIFDGTVPDLTDVTCDPAVSGVPIDSGGATLVTRLFANQPNPFNPRTALRFSLARRQQTSLAIYDVSGRRVRDLVDDTLDSGMHEIVWDGTDDAGRALAAGVYWSQLTTLGFRGSRKMIVLE